MNQNKIYEYCKSKGFKLSMMSLYRIGKKKGFLKLVSGSEKSNNFEKYEFDKEMFDEWIKSTEIESGYMAISSAVKKYGIQYNAFLYYLTKNDLPVKKMGHSPREMMYARESDIMRVVEKYNKNTEGAKND